MADVPMSPISTLKSSCGGQSLTSINRDETFYFDSEPVILQVGGVLFKVIKSYFITESEVFRDMFSFPAPTWGVGVEGTSDERPIILEGIDSEDFKSFLKVLYALNGPIKYRAIPTKSIRIQDWECALELSRKWMFNSIYEKAINELKKLLDSDPAKCLYLRKKYEITSWNANNMMELLVNRDNRLDAREVELLTPEVALFITEMREAKVRDALREVNERKTLLQGQLSRCKCDCQQQSNVPVRSPRTICKSGLKRPMETGVSDWKPRKW